MRGDAGSAGAAERIKNGISFVGEKFDEPRWQLLGEGGTVAFIAAFGGQVQHIRGVSLIAAQPVCDVFPKTAADLRIKTNHIVFAEGLQPRIRPVSHGHHHGLLIHLKPAGLVELQAPLPGIPEAIGPLAGVTIFLVPNEFLGPEPPLLAKRQNQFNNEGVPLTILNLFFDVKNKRAGRAENSQKLGAAGKKPLSVLFGRHTAVGVFPPVGVGWGGDDQIESIAGILCQDFQAIPFNNFGSRFFHHQSKSASCIAIRQVLILPDFLRTPPNIKELARSAG